MLVQYKKLIYPLILFYCLFSFLSSCSKSNKQDDSVKSGGSHSNNSDDQETLISEDEAFMITNEEDPDSPALDQNYEKGRKNTISRFDGLNIEFAFDKVNYAGEIKKISNIKGMKKLDKDHHVFNFSVNIGKYCFDPVENPDDCVNEYSDVLATYNHQSKKLEVIYPLSSSASTIAAFEVLDGNVYFYSNLDYVGNQDEYDMNSELVLYSWKKGETARPLIVNSKSISGKKYYVHKNGSLNDPPYIVKLDGKIYFYAWVYDKPNQEYIYGQAGRTVEYDPISGTGEILDYSIFIENIRERGNTLTSLYNGNLLGFDPKNKTFFSLNYFSNQALNIENNNINSFSKNKFFIQAIGYNSKDSDFIHFYSYSHLDKNLDLLGTFNCPYDPSIPGGSHLGICQNKYQTENFIIINDQKLIFSMPIPTILNSDDYKVPRPFKTFIVEKNKPIVEAPHINELNLDKTKNKYLILGDFKFSDNQEKEILIYDTEKKLTQNEDFFLAYNPTLNNLKKIKMDKGNCDFSKHENVNYDDIIHTTNNNKINVKEHVYFSLYSKAISVEFKTNYFFQFKNNKEIKCISDKFNGGFIK